MLDILIPVLSRPYRVEPLLASIAETTDVPHRVLFLCSTGDREEIAAVKAAGAEHLTMKAPPAQGQYAKKINQGYRETKGERLFLGADDLRFRAGWAGIAFKFDFGVVATNDLGNYFVRQGLLATHSVIKREYIDEQGGSLDGPGSIYHEGYSHNFVDCELSVLARNRGAFAFARQAVVEHLHPVTGKSQMDEVYKFGLSDFDVDRALFVQRLSEYPRDRLYRRFADAVRATRVRNRRGYRR
jgi:hypothetical protein